MMAVLHIINKNEMVSQILFLDVFSSLFTFFIIVTKFKQNTIHSIGIKNQPIYKNGMTNSLFPLEYIFFETVT